MLYIFRNSGLNIYSFHNGTRDSDRWEKWVESSVD